MSVVITSQPLDVISVDGQQYSVTVVATGNGVIHYSWLEYQSLEDQSGTPIGTDSFKLTIGAPGVPGSNKFYECVLTDDDPGSITTRRLSKTSIPDATTVTNSAPSMNDCSTLVIFANVLRYGLGTGIFFKWQRNEGSGWVDEAGWSILSPQAEEDLVVPLVITTGNTLAKNGWLYKLLVSYDQTNTDSSTTATLLVTAGPPLMDIAPVNLNIDVGNPLVLALFQSSCSSVTFAWLKGVTTIVGETGSVFTIDPVAAGDFGAYTQKATNAGGLATASRIVTVNDPALNLNSGRRRFYVGNQAN